MLFNIPYTLVFPTELIKTLIIYNIPQFGHQLR